MLLSGMMLLITDLIGTKSNIRSRKTLIKFNLIVWSNCPLLRINFNKHNREQNSNNEMKAFVKFNSNRKKKLYY